MIAYFLRRILISIASLLIISYALWLLTTRNGINFLHQFDVTQIFFPPDYLKWLSDIAHGNFGYSLRAKMPVIDAFRMYLPITLLLLIPALIIQEIISITAGVTSATRLRSPIGIGLQYIFVIAASLPIFWLALMSITLFGVILHWFPFIGLSSLRLTGADFGTPEYWQFFHAHTWDALQKGTQQQYGELCTSLGAVQP